MNPTKREIAHIELDAQWTRVHRAWDNYYSAERALNAISLKKEDREARRLAVIHWASARDSYRTEYRELKHLMRIAIQYKRL